VFSFGTAGVLCYSTYYQQGYTDTQISHLLKVLNSARIHADGASSVRGRLVLGLGRRAADGGLTARGHIEMKQNLFAERSSNMTCR
jgi:hypothetical protein